jgi:ribosomal protein S4
VNISQLKLRRGKFDNDNNKIIEELSQLYGKSDAKQDEIQHTKARLGEVLKKKWKTKIMYMCST